MPLIAIFSQGQELPLERTNDRFAAYVGYDEGTRRYIVSSRHPRTLRIEHSSFTDKDTAFHNARVVSDEPIFTTKL